MKKLLVAALLASATLSLAGCGKSNEKENVTIKEMVTTEDEGLQSGQSILSSSHTMTVQLDKLGIAADQRLAEYEGIVNHNKFVPGYVQSVEMLHLNDEVLDSYKKLFDLTFSFYEFDEKEMTLTFSGYNNPSITVDDKKGTIKIVKDAYIKE